MNVQHPAKLVLPLLLAGLIAIALIYWLNAGPGSAEGYDIDDFKAEKVANSSAETGSDEPQLGSVSEMLLGLKKRLETDSDDVGGWLLLAQSYYHLDRLAEAKEAFAKAEALGYTGAWKPLPRIDSAIQAENTAGFGGSEINLDHYAVAAVDGSDKPAAGQPSSAGISLKVALAAGMQDQLAPDTPVFVFARNVAGSGPPLAVLQKKVSQLPLEITLDDSHAMVPGNNISSVERVIVGARVSISGNAVGQPGDLEQLSNPVSSRSGEAIEIIIKSKI